MNTVKTRMLRRSKRDMESPIINGAHCLMCDLVGVLDYSSIGVPLDWSIVNGLNKKQPPTHRVAWVLSRGRPIPKGKKVLHRCDRMKCVEPRHLFLGTQADNVADMVRKGRNVSPKGAASPNAKLTEIQAIAIFHAKGNQRLLAESYNVSLGLVEQIKSGRAWGYLNLKGTTP